MNHREYFDQAAAEWDTMEWEETHVRLREIVAEKEKGPIGGAIAFGQ